MPESLSLADMNRLSKQQFIEKLGSIFEHSPWVAEAAYASIPFNSVAQLHKAMQNIVDQSSIQQRLTLIRNHPQLAGKEASAGTLTDDSRKEQSNAGLDQCTALELAQLRELNLAYQQKFDFPFIIAVTGLNKTNIIDALALRLQSSPEVEFDTCLIEIAKIGRIRLNALLVE
jgi:2-oxo-4-hydroxy-4-carboxy-5-ureidoimidazoline decarboxylase